MYEHQLISEYPASYWLSDEWTYRMAVWCNIIGITDIPEGIPLQLIEEVIINDFRGHSFAEIELALKMCALGEFSEPIEAYNRLNIPFLGKVMKAYRKFRKDAANKYEEIKFKIQKPEPVIPSAFEVDITVAQQIWDDYIRVINDVDIFPLSHKYDLLLRLGIVSSEETSTIRDDIAKQVIGRNADLIINQAERLKVKDLQQNNENLFIHAENKAKQLCYEVWLKAMKETKVTFDQFCEIVESKIFIKYGKR